MTTKRDVGLAVKNLRKKANLRQKDLARKINPSPIDDNTISRIETGKHNYTIDLLFRIAAALDCDISDFFEPKKKFPGTDIYMAILEDTVTKIVEERVKDLKKRR